MKNKDASNLLHSAFTTTLFSPLIVIIISLGERWQQLRVIAMGINHVRIGITIAENIGIKEAATALPIMLLFKLSQIAAHLQFWSCSFW